MSEPATYVFGSDNAAPICPEVLQAIVACNTNPATAYGADRWTAKLNGAFSDFFERPTFAFPVTSGTAGNGLALGAVTPGDGAIFCHRNAHILTTEGGAPEFYSGGGRLIPVDGADNKITPDTLAAALARYDGSNPHTMEASTLSLTQATECGVTYRIDELGELTAIAHRFGLKVHMDGARFSNALAYLGCSAAELTWTSGIDILTYGTTKNGTMNAEAVLVFDADTAWRLQRLHKRAGHLCSKMRFMSAQLLRHLEDDLWRKNALRANAHASRVAAALQTCPGVLILHPIEINEVFASLPDALSHALASAGIRLRPWAHETEDKAVRCVLSFDEADITLRSFEKTCQEYASEKAMA